MIGRIFLAAFARGFVSEQQPHAKPPRRPRPFRNTDLPREKATVSPLSPVSPSEHDSALANGFPPEPLPSPVVPPGHVDTGTFSRLAQDDAERRAWLADACRREAEYERERCRVKGGADAS